MQIGDMGASACNDGTKAKRNNCRLEKDPDGQGIILVAARDIEAGEELLCSYGSYYWKK